MMMNNSFIALYLSDQDSNILLPIITRLQSEYSNLPPFEPHITVPTAINTDLPSAIEVIKRVASVTKQFSVESDGFGYQDRWSKILYLKIKENEKLKKIYNDIGTGLHGFDPKPYVSHISLMYKDELSTEEREKTISCLVVPSTFLVKGIEIVGSDTTGSNWRDYAKWKVEYRKDFK